MAPAGLLCSTGWDVRDIVPAPELAARYLANSRLPLSGLNPGAICVAAVRSA